jgi:hypothetical protein
MTIHGSDLPPGVTAERYLDGFHQTLVKRAYKEGWECDCPEYREIRPNTARAYCKHTEKAGLGLVNRWYWAKPEGLLLGRLQPPRFSENQRLSGRYRKKQPFNLGGK